MFNSNYKTLDLSLRKKVDEHISSRPYTNSQYNILDDIHNNKDRLLFAKTIQPSDIESEKDKPKFLNKDNLYFTQKDNYTFHKIKNDLENPKDEKYLYFNTNDPRLFDARTNQMKFVDDIPLGNGGITNPNKIYSQGYSNYGKSYSDYSDINIGNIIYRTEVGVDSEPFKNPNFVIKTGVKYNLFENPMQNVQTEYVRTPFTRDNGDELSRLESLRMSMNFREDLMATQDNKFNARKWNYRWKEPVKRIL